MNLEQLSRETAEKILQRGEFLTFGTKPESLMPDILSALNKVVKEIREAAAQYMSSEGCSCCQGEDHSEDEDRLAMLLGVYRYDDDSGWNWKKYKPKE